MKKKDWALLLLFIASLLLMLAIIPTEYFHPNNIAFEIEGDIVSVNANEFGAIESLTLRTKNEDACVDILSSRVITLSGKLSKHRLQQDMRVYISLSEETPLVARLVSRLARNHVWQARRAVNIALCLMGRLPHTP